MSRMSSPCPTAFGASCRLAKTACQRNLIASTSLKRKETFKSTVLKHGSNWQAAMQFFNIISTCNAKHANRSNINIPEPKLRGKTLSKTILALILRLFTVVKRTCFCAICILESNSESMLTYTATSSAWIAFQIAFVRLYQRNAVDSCISERYTALI